MQAAARRESFLQRHPVAAYFFLTFATSWLGAFLEVAPHILRHESIPKTSGLLMFPALLLGPSFAGILLTRVIDGKSGLRKLASRMRRMRFPAKWYAVLLIPPVLIMAVLLDLKAFISPVFAPGLFPMGIMFGCFAGFVEEIGWTGYAFPKMRVRLGEVTASIVLGLMWGFWHLPVIDYLGTATPHGAFLLRYFLVFIAAMTAIRVLIGWIYVHTESVWIAQLMHASSTSCLVIFSPSPLTAAQETFWYGTYAVVLWATVAIIFLVRGRRDLNSQAPRQPE